MNHAEAHDAIDHPARDGLLRQARDDNPDPGQRDAARATLIRLATEGRWARPVPDVMPPTPEDLALRAHLVKHGCCGGGVTG